MSGYEEPNPAVIDLDEHSLDAGVKAKRTKPYVWNPTLGAYERMTPNTGMIRDSYDTINVTQVNAVTDAYEYKSGATTVGTVTIVYTDSTKANISSITKT